jgi:hypothetical protein
MMTTESYTFPSDGAVWQISVTKYNTNRLNPEETNKRVIKIIPPTTAPQGPIVFTIMDDIWYTQYNNHTDVGTTCSMGEFYINTTRYTIGFMDDTTGYIHIYNSDLDIRNGLAEIEFDIPYTVARCLMTIFNELSWDDIRALTE